MFNGCPSNVTAGDSYDPDDTDLQVWNEYEDAASHSSVDTYEYTNIIQQTSTEE